MARTLLDPFGLWPQYRSALAGLHDGELSPKANYAFHTVYVRLDFGAATLRVRFDGVSGETGVLRVRLQSTLGDAPAQLLQEQQVKLAEVRNGEIELVFAFDIDTRRSYAIRGVLRGCRDAVATMVEIAVEQPSESEDFSRLLLAARRTLSEAPALHKRVPWLRSGKIERSGLSQAGPATLAEPVSQMCTAAQFAEPEYRHWMTVMNRHSGWHRKSWELVYILTVLERFGMLAPGRQGLGFGTGVEPLPAVMAVHGCTVTATDLAADNRVAIGWAATNQHANGLESLWHPEIIDRPTFERSITFRSADMNDIPDDLRGFDFCWSACAFEHLGSIDAGLRFVEESVKTLRSGGVAVHTTELNLSSNEKTIDQHDTVLFRRRDFEKLALRLTDQGHRVLPLCWDQGQSGIDDYVDVAPYREDHHLKLALAGFITTSFGFIVIRG